MRYAGRPPSHRGNEEVLVPCAFIPFGSAWFYIGGQRVGGSSVSADSCVLNKSRDMTRARGVAYILNIRQLEVVAHTFGTVFEEREHQFRGLVSICRFSKIANVAVIAGNNRTEMDCLLRCRLVNCAEHPSTASKPTLEIQFMPRLRDGLCDDVRSLFLQEPRNSREKPQRRAPSSVCTS